MVSSNVEAPGTSGRSSGKRAAHSKKRTGCITCKARHVKCDERKPTCEKCEKSGRTCDGYGSPESLVINRTKKHAGFRAFKEPILVNPGRQPGPENVNFSPPESHALDHFYNRTLIVLRRQSQSPTWIAPILHLHDTDDMLRQCCVALGALHEHYILNGYPVSASTASSTPSMQETLANANYMLALRSLSEGISYRKMSTDTIRMACVLMTIYESMRGNTIAYSMHLRSGIRMSPSALVRAPDEVDEPIDSALWRLGYLFAMYTRPFDSPDTAEIQMIQLPVLDQPIPDPSSVSSARFAMTHLMPGVINYIRNCIHSRYETELDALVTLTKVRNALLRIGRGIKTLSQDTTLSQDDSRFCKECLASITLFSIIVDTSKRTNQSIYDTMSDRFETYLDYYDDILEVSTSSSRSSTRSPGGLAASSGRPSPSTPTPPPPPSAVHQTTHRQPMAPASLSASSSHTSQQPPKKSPTPQRPRTAPDPAMRTLSFDLGYIPGLMYAGINCREPLLRRRVLKLLTQVPRREGPWDAVVVSKLIEAIIELEERGLDGMDIHKRKPELIHEDVRVDAVEVAEWKINENEGDSNDPGLAGGGGHMRNSPTAGVLRKGTAQMPGPNGAEIVSAADAMIAIGARGAVLNRIVTLYWRMSDEARRVRTWYARPRREDYVYKWSFVI